MTTDSKISSRPLLLSTCQISLQLKPFEITMSPSSVQKYPGKRLICAYRISPDATVIKWKICTGENSRFWEPPPRWSFLSFLPPSFSQREHTKRQEDNIFTGFNKLNYFVSANIHVQVLLLITATSGDVLHVESAIADLTTPHSICCNTWHYPTQHLSSRIIHTCQL